MIWRPELFLFVLAAGIFHGTVAMSEDLETTTDLRCLAASVKAGAYFKDHPEQWIAYLKDHSDQLKDHPELLKDHPDQAMRDALQGGFTYWLGRLDGHDPTFDLENGLIRTLKEMKAEEVGPTLARCGAVLIARGQAEENIGKKMLQQLDEQKHK